MDRYIHLPERIDRVVDFPAPLCPRRTVICPTYKFKDKSFIAILVVFCTRNSCWGKPTIYWLYHYHFGRTSTHINYIYKKLYHIINLMRKLKNPKLRRLKMWLEKISEGITWAIKFHSKSINIPSVISIHALIQLTS